MDKNTALIIGGSSGLGLELGLLFEEDHRVFITGRHNPEKSGLACTILDLSTGPRELGSALDALLGSIPPVTLLVYAAGFSQQVPISSLEDSDIAAMISVGLTAPAMLIQRVIRKQRDLPGLIMITSTSQWIPRPHEPLYTSVKAGLGMLGNSLSFDPAIGKVLVAAPGGMATPFWRNDEKDVSGMLDAPWVARQIQAQFREKFRYRFVRIPRDPARVEIGETRLEETP